MLKSKQNQAKRTKAKAEVFTPSWVCNAQNNLVDDAWLGYPNAFNTQTDTTWQATTTPIAFPQGKTWQAYVEECRLEITCGEAPYLVSRYDTTTGAKIPLIERIGLLDRKLRVVGENTTTKEAWLEWAKKALQSIYAFEYQGDNLLLARENILATYADYRENKWQEPTPLEELKSIAEIISHNIFQMDGLTGAVPFKTQEAQLNVFDFNNEDSTKYLSEEKLKETTKPILAQIYDWKENKSKEFKYLWKTE